MRCECLAQDRVDSSEAIKCLARALSKPKAGHMTQWKRVARYLKGVPREALQYHWQEPSRAHLEVHVESDWAGDTATRRSRSGVIVWRGLHLLRHSSTVQSVIGLSGAERVEGCKIAIDAYYGLNSAKWSRVDNGQDEEPAGIIEPFGVVVVGTSQRERRIRITR